MAIVTVENVFYEEPAAVSASKISLIVTGSCGQISCLRSKGAAGKHAVQGSKERGRLAGVRR